MAKKEATSPEISSADARSDSALKKTTGYNPSKQGMHLISFLRRKIIGQLLLLCIACLLGIVNESSAQVKGKYKRIITEDTCINKGGKLSPDSNYQACLFSNGAVFIDCVFKKDISFQMCSFERKAVIIGNRFTDNAFFAFSVFPKVADLSYNSVPKMISFVRATFSESVYFKYLTLTESSTLLFDDAKLADTIDFSCNMKIYNDIDLTTANFKDLSFDKKDRRFHYIYLYRSDLARFHIDYIHFRLLFINPQDSMDKMSDEQKGAMYETLLKNFKDRGQNESYEALDKEYKDYQYSLGNWWFKKLGKINKWWWEYGYNKRAVFIHSFWFVVWFTIINFFLLNYLNLKVYNISKIPAIPEILTVSKRKPSGLISKEKNMFALQVMRRLWYSFSYTATIFFSLSLKPDKIEFKKILGSIYLLLIYCIGIICLAYMANFVLQK